LFCIELKLELQVTLLATVLKMIIKKGCQMAAFQFNLKFID